jgi:hypothetical protein
MNRDLDRIVPRPVRRCLVGRVGESLRRKGLAAEVSIVADSPLALPSPRPLAVLGSRGPACAPAVAIVLCPESRRPAEAHRWARTLTGQDIVRAVAADLLPAHVAVRPAYLVPNRRGRWLVSDPPIIGIARWGRTVLEMQKMQMKKHRSLVASPDATVLEIVMDIHEVFKIPLRDPRFDELKDRLAARVREGRREGQVIDATDLDRIDALERLMSQFLELAPTPARDRSKGPTEPTPIPINTRRKS